MTRWSSRRDANASTIFGKFLKMGALDYIDLAEVGGGCPDGLILDPRRRVRMVEVKNPDTAYGKKGLNDLQQRLERKGWPIEVAQTIEDVATLMKRWSKR